MSDLRAYPLARPTAEQEAAVRRAELRARRVAAVPLFTVVWVTAPGASRFGQCDQYAGGRAEIVLRSDLPADVLERIALHELGHVAAGPSEAAAEAFVRNAYQEDPMMQTNGHTSTGAAHQALLDEGRLLATRAERGGRGFSAAERRRAGEILAALGSPAPVRSSTPHARPVPICVCGGPLMGRAIARCSRCGRMPS